MGGRIRFGWRFQIVWRIWVGQRSWVDGEWCPIHTADIPVLSGDMWAAQVGVDEVYDGPAVGVEVGVVVL